jgi:hypothetical protein
MDSLPTAELPEIYPTGALSEATLDRIDAAPAGDPLFYYVVTIPETGRSFPRACVTTRLVPNSLGGRRQFILTSNAGRKKWRTHGRPNRR